MTSAYATESVAIDTLKAHPRNYRVHPDDQIAHLGQSIREHGFYRNVVIANDNTILAGHGVVQAAQSIGLTDVPVIRLTIGPDDPKALKILTGDNELGSLAEIDDRELTELLKEIASIDVDGLLGTGYDDQMLANLIYVTRPASEIATINEASHWVGMPEFGGEGHEIPPKLVISFDSLDGRAEFIKQIGIEDQIHKKLVSSPTWSAWWPPRDRQDLASLRFDEDE